VLKITHDSVAGVERSRFERCLAGPSVDELRDLLRSRGPS
jgi:hypothetical protein